MGFGGVSPFQLLILVGLLLIGLPVFIAHLESLR